MEKKRNAVLVKDLLSDMMMQLSQHQLSDQLKIEEAWGQIKKQYTSEAMFDGFHDGVVYICVANSTQRFIWNGRRTELLRQLQEVSNNVQQIVFKIRKS